MSEKPTDFLAYKKGRERESKRSWLLLIDKSRRDLLEEILDTYETTTETTTENMGLHSAPLQKQQIVNYLNTASEDELRGNPARVVGLINRLQELSDNE